MREACKIFTKSRTWINFSVYDFVENALRNLFIESTRLRDCARLIEKHALFYPPPYFKLFRFPPLFTFLQLFDDFAVSLHGKHKNALNQVWNFGKLGKIALKLRCWSYIEKLGWFEKIGWFYCSNRSSTRSLLRSEWSSPSQNFQNLWSPVFISRHQIPNFYNTSKKGQNQNSPL